MTTPLADPANIVTGSTYRITVLNDGLLRLEYSSAGVFEDRASQMVVNRAFAPAEFTVDDTENGLEIRTERLHLVYDKNPFSADGLSIRIAGSKTTDGPWRYGMRASNLGGTARTLDGADGPTPLEDGVLSRAGIAVVDDSRTVLLDVDGWIAPRHRGNVDLYVFAFGRDYRDALSALYELTGPQPLLPRFALGNWWSRYYPYTADEYLQLMDRFRAEDVPLSVAILDMDWHQVQIEPKFGTGWTGYTWNSALFPDPPGFLGELRKRGLRTALNVHPAEGVHAHEESYARIATRLGIDPATERPIEFDLTARAFVEAYFEELHHPHEAAGVDFWWLDWQQGGVTKVAGLDPLWLLNHFHYLDSGRDGARPLTFSRYAGVGSHRYPIGFSGDAFVTWATLDFQPYFTATASNVGFGWWSHDIGGHCDGIKDDELATRWVQFGVFSPIMRLHSTYDRFNSREPWRHGREAQRVMSEFLRLRHQLIPYLYTMNVRAHLDGEPLVQPMYYSHPWDEAAYKVGNQFMFGTELLVAPITTPGDRSTGLAGVKAWLPEGDWIDFFTGLTYRGGDFVQLHRDLDSIPVLARAGAIIPMTPPAVMTDAESNPAELEVCVYAGADGDFTLAEDNDGELWARTRFTFLARPDGGAEIVVHAVDGHVGTVPAVRDYRLVLCGFTRVDAVQVSVGGVTQQGDLGPGPTPGSMAVRVRNLGRDASARIHLTGDLALALNDVHDRLFRLLDQATIERTVKNAIYDAVLANDRADLAMRALLGLEVPAELFSAIGELLLARPPGPIL